MRNTHIRWFSKIVKDRCRGVSLLHVYSELHIMFVPEIIYYVKDFIALRNMLNTHSRAESNLMMIA